MMSPHKVYRTLLDTKGEDWFDTIEVAERRADDMASRRFEEAAYG